MSGKEIKIKAVKLYEKGFMIKSLAFGGEVNPPEFFDNSEVYRSSLQNYVIDTGDEVILVDTGMPEGTPEQVVDEKLDIYMGHKIEEYVPALKRVGYTPEQVTKILVTHKHADHTGALHNFPQAKIYIGAGDAGAEEYKGLKNVIPVEFTDGPYYNFSASQKIADGVYFIKAVGHTLGNSLIIVESDGLFYMLHGDLTYTDEALYKNELSTVYEDLPAFRRSLDEARQFISEHPTVYCGTHTPLGYENLEAKRVVDLDKMPEPLPVEENEFKVTATGKYICSVCGYVYDPEKGDPERGIPAGTKFEDLPADWHCPRCKQGKEKFNKA